MVNENDDLMAPPSDGIELETDQQPTIVPTVGKEIAEIAPPEDIETSNTIDRLQKLDERIVTDLEVRADAWVKDLSGTNSLTTDFESKLDEIRTLGSRTFENTGSTSNRLMEASLASTKKNGSSNQVAVTKDLAELREVMDELAPTEKNLTSKILGIIPGGNSIKKYFHRFESNQDQLNSILVSLDRGQEGLRKDTAALRVEQKGLYDGLQTLHQYFVMLGAMDDRLVKQIQIERGRGNSALADALEKDALPVVRQRRMDVITQVALSMQGYMVMNLIAKNNTDVIAGVDRAKNTTVVALRTAIVTAQALENQRLVLNAIDALNETTDRYMNMTADMLSENGDRIRAQASSPTVKLETLNKTFDVLFGELEKADRAAVEGNKKMLETIDAAQVIVNKAQPYLNRMSGKTVAESTIEDSGVNLQLER